jgi:hypothetical protein
MFFEELILQERERLPKYKHQCLHLLKPC